MDPVTREAYSHEVTSCGFWPGDRRFQQAAFYAYSAPVPPGLERSRCAPPRLIGIASSASSSSSTAMPARAASPDQAILDFCQSAYEAGAKLAQWDRASLER